MKDKTVFADLLLTIATLTVRHEFCVHVEEAGGLKFVRDGMVKSKTFFFWREFIFLNVYFISSFFF